MTYNSIIVGAGLAGLVIAERLARINNEKILIIEQRNHIGGNCFDFYNDHGILVHQYGPHIFHTDNTRVWDYLSQFTDWHYYQHTVLGMIDGQYVPIPFNINTLYQLFPNSIASRIERKLISNFGFGAKLPINELMKFDDQDLNFIAQTVYDKIYLNYSLKQWGDSFQTISSKILSRVPVVITKDNRYFYNRYQGLPKQGFTRMFHKMIDHPNIKILLNTSMSEVIELTSSLHTVNFLGRPFSGNLIFTGMIDELFSYEFGELPYRSLNFIHETIKNEYFQMNSVINYPNDYDFTRITEFKHMTSQNHSFTAILREYPCRYDKNKEMVPCYPMITSENQKILAKYQQLENQFGRLFLIGRLAEYKYYDMDDMVENALNLFDEKLRIV
jgi:UDP-galactopyranose mutase